MNNNFGKHSDPYSVVELFNDDMKAYHDLYDSEIRNCGFNPERVQCWNELKAEMREYRKDVINFVWEKHIRTSILEFNRRYAIVGPATKKTSSSWEQHVTRILNDLLVDEFDEIFD